MYIYINIYIYIYNSSLCLNVSNGLFLDWNVVPSLVSGVLVSGADCLWTSYFLVHSWLHWLIVRYLLPLWVAVYLVASCRLACSVTAQSAITFWYVLLWLPVGFLILIVGTVCSEYTLLYFVLVLSWGINTTIYQPSTIWYISVLLLRNLYQI